MEHLHIWRALAHLGLSVQRQHFGFDYSHQKKKKPKQSTSSFAARAGLSKSGAGGLYASGEPTPGKLSTVTTGKHNLYLMVTVLPPPVTSPYFVSVFQISKISGFPPQTQAPKCPPQKCFINRCLLPCVQVRHAGSPARERAIMDGQ